MSETTISKTMGITHKEFHEGISALLDGIPYSRDDNTIQFQWQGKAIRISLGAEGVRQLGQSVCLPMTSVTLHFSAWTDKEIHDFINYFNLKFMKGGG